MKIIQSEALSSLFCFQSLFRLIFGRGDYRFYDDLSRLIEADYNKGATVYNYGYDVAGNLVDYDGVTRTYNAANQMTNDGTNTLTYDDNGNLTGNGSDTYVWDRANRLLSVGNHSYVYDGLGNRVQQTVSSVVTDYLNDVQPGLTKLLKQDDGSNVDRFVHGVRGIHAVDDGTDWNYYAQDGLGSVRAVVDDMAVVQSSLAYDSYGNVLGATSPTDFGFTGEQTDENGRVFLRARYYEPAKGIFSALDPFEGIQNRPMSLNGYSWVEGNPVMNVDPSGMQSCPDYCTPNNYVITNEDSYWTRVNKRRVRLQCEALGCNNLFSDGGRVVTPTPDPFSVPMSTFTPDIIICPTPSPTMTSTPTATNTPTPSITPSPIATQTSVVNPTDVDIVAYVIACEAGLYQNPYSDNARQQAIDISHSIRTRINSSIWGDTAPAVVSEGQGSQFNCYRDIANNTRNSNFAIGSVQDLAIALINGDSLPPPTDERMSNAPFYYAPSSYFGAMDAEASSISQATILANLDNAGICNKNNFELNQIYAGHSPFNSLAQTTVFFTEFPECFCAEC